MSANRKTLNFIILSAVVLLSAPSSSAQAARIGHTVRVAGADPLPPSDWAAIQEAHDIARLGAFTSSHGLSAANHRQCWQTEFDGRGFLILPDLDGWSFGLELSSISRADDFHEFDHARHLEADENHVSYHWNDDFTEWYVNSASGLEHGYTLYAPPFSTNARRTGEFQLTMSIRGNLCPRTSSDRTSVEFVDASGSVVVNYANLYVSDADGRKLSAHFEASTDWLRLIVRDADARYPIVVDPIVQQAYLKASNTGQADVFGHAVAISGDTVVVGAPHEDSNATGINGNQADNSSLDSGAAYIFVRNNSIWTQQAYLKASNTEPNDEFGWSVAISGDTVVVGAHLEDSNATGVNGDQSNNLAALSGAAYVFVRNGTTWTQQAYLKASNTETVDFFADSIAISENTIVVGAGGEDSAASGVNGDESDNTASRAGAAYVFVRDGAVWSQQAYLKASNPGEGDTFTNAVAIDQNTIIIGATGESSNATGVNGNQKDDSASRSGAAYVFFRVGSIWGQQAYLKASNTSALDLFGGAVGVSGDTAVVGARWEDSDAAGVDGDQANDRLEDSGAAYVFVRHGDTWSQQAYLKASNTGSSDEFGSSVAIAANSIVIGAPEEDSNSTGINGDQSNNSAAFSGAAYVFARVGGTWVQQAYVKASNTQLADHFGSSVAISAYSFVVGAVTEDSGATGVNGAQDDNSATSSGAAYIFNGAGPTCVADLDVNGQVDLSDLALLLADFGCNSEIGDCSGDLNDDGHTDLSDLNLLLTNFGTFCP